MEYFVTALREHQELTIFLTLAVGFLIGRLRFGSFSLGTVVGTLLAGVLIGQLDIKVAPVGEERLLRSVPVHHRLQGGAPVLPRPEEGRAAAAGGHRRVVRHVPDQRVHGVEAPGVRHGNGGRAPRRGLHGVDGHRHCRRRDQSARPSGGGKDRAGEQYPGRVRRDLPDRNRVHRVVPAERRTQVDGNRSEGGKPEAAGPGGWRRRVGAGRDLGAPAVRGPRVPGDARATAEPDGRLDRGAAGRPACLHLEDPSRQRDHRAEAGHDHPSGRCRGGDDSHRAADGAGHRDRPRG